MARPPKRINPGAHRTVNHSTSDGRRFRKGRYPVTPAELNEESGSTVVIGPDDTETGNATFPAAPEPAHFDAATGEDLEPKTRSSKKYDARPSSGVVPIDADTREDVVVDLTDEGKIERKIVIDLTKLPPVDLNRRSTTVYVRHSDGWPTKERRRSTWRD